MCGIIGGVSERDIIPTLINGLLHLEYRGYDSCGIAVLNHGKLHRIRGTRQIVGLKRRIEKSRLSGFSGIAHTRWATHGSPIASNAHPHFSGRKNQARIAIVHNGIVENYKILQKDLLKKGYKFKSQTDTEVIAHLIDHFYEYDLLKAVRNATNHIEGIYAIAVLSKNEPERLIGACNGSPLIVGIGENENFLSSDKSALDSIVKKIVYLKNGETIDLKKNKITIFNEAGQPKNLKSKTIQTKFDNFDLGKYKHYMEKEIFEQPEILKKSLKNFRTVNCKTFGNLSEKTFRKIDSILVLGCGTSYYAGLIAKYWFEAISKITTSVEMSSEYRYRLSLANPKSLVMAISQSGETADTLAAIKHAKSLGMKKILTICNVQTSSIVQESLLSYITQAGKEISVASTKSFTAQITSLFMLALVLAKVKNNLSEIEEKFYINELKILPQSVEAIFSIKKKIEMLANYLSKKRNISIIGRGIYYPIALEGALKLKETSYIHAEAFQASEMKHGPLALIKKGASVIVIAPQNSLFMKLQSNMQEIQARGGKLHIITESAEEIFSNKNDIDTIEIPGVCGVLSPILYTVTLQMLAYEIALCKGINMDKPRNLAKSVTVE